MDEWKVRVNKEEKDLKDAIKNSLNKARLKKNKRMEAKRMLKAQLAAKLAAEQRRKATKAAEIYDRRSKPNSPLTLLPSRKREMTRRSREKSKRRLSKQD